MQVLTRETVELARSIRRQLRALGHEVPALSDPELVERLEAMAASTADAALQAEAGRLCDLAAQAAEADMAITEPARQRYRGAAPLPQTPAEPSAAPKPRRYYRGVPIDD